MKKILCLVGAIAFTFTSCSSDENNNDFSNLVKKITYTNSNGSSYSEEMTYNGRKISTLKGEDYLIKYTYTQDCITKVEKFDENNELFETTEYAYTNGKLTSSLEK